LRRQGGLPVVRHVHPHTPSWPRACCIVCNADARGVVLVHDIAGRDGDNAVPIAKRLERLALRRRSCYATALRGRGQAARAQNGAGTMIAWHRRNWDWILAGGLLLLL